jgi:hypothetical protein
MSLGRMRVSGSLNRLIRNRRLRLDRAGTRGRGRAGVADKRASDVTDKGESALTERVQRQRGNGRLQGSEGVRTVRSRSDGGRDPRGSEPFDQDRTGEIRQGKQTCAKRYPRSEPFDPNRMEGIRPGK